MLYRCTSEDTKVGLDATQIQHDTTSAVTSLRFIGRHSFLPLGTLIQWANFYSSYSFKLVGQEDKWELCIRHNEMRKPRRPENAWERREKTKEYMEMPFRSSSPKAQPSYWSEIPRSQDAKHRSNINVALIRVFENFSGSNSAHATLPLPRARSHPSSPRWHEVSIKLLNFVLRHSNTHQHAPSN